MSETSNRYRKMMRGAALKMRRCLQPAAFDGSLVTYNRNLKQAVFWLQRAILLRKSSHES